MTDNGVDTEPGHWSGNDSRKVFNFQFPFEYLWHRWLVPLIVFRWALGGKGVWREVSDCNSGRLILLHLRQRSPILFSDDDPKEKLGNFPLPTEQYLSALRRKTEICPVLNETKTQTSCVCLYH